MSLNPKDSPYWDLFDDYPDHLEYNLFDSVVSEYNDVSGFPIYYYIRLISETSDDIYGENPTEEYSDPYRTKLIYEPSEEPQILEFGISSDDTLEYAQLTKTIFDRDVSDPYILDKEIDSIVPKAGDLIKTLWNNKTYEVVYVGSETRIFQGKKYIWDFICKPYRYSYESESSDNFLFNDPDSDDFPDINVTTETESYTTSGDTIKQRYGDNEVIEDESDDVSDIDTSIYGY